MMYALYRYMYMYVLYYNIKLPEMYIDIKSLLKALLVCLRCIIEQYNITVWFHRLWIGKTYSLWPVLDILFYFKQISFSEIDTSLPCWNIYSFYERKNLRERKYQIIMYELRFKFFAIVWPKLLLINLYRFLS